MKIEFRKVTPDARIPTYAQPGDAGADLAAIQDRVIFSGAREPVRTGLCVAIPEGWVGLVVPRSGLARRYGVTLANSPGVIDSGYRGELVCVVVNQGTEAFSIAAGDRIAQLVIVPCLQADFAEVEQLADSVRGVDGFGSTGVR